MLAGLEGFFHILVPIQIFITRNVFGCECVLGIPPCLLIALSFALFLLYRVVWLGGLVEIRRPMVVLFFNSELFDLAIFIVVERTRVL